MKTEGELVADAIRDCLGNSTDYGDNLVGGTYEGLKFIAGAISTIDYDAETKNRSLTDGVFAIAEAINRLASVIKEKGQLSPPPKFSI